MRYAVVTAFPLKQYDLCAREMLRTFDANWPEDVDLYISLDCVPEEDLRRIDSDINGMFKSKRQYYVCNEFSPQQQQFLGTHKDDGNDYRFHVCRFSYKVFALHQCMLHVKDHVDYLIWLDADVITHKPISHDDLASLSPQRAQASYLGRMDAPHSECGFVMYDLKKSEELIKNMVKMYLTDEVLTLKGWTDCDVFDACLSEGRNLSESIKGWHVWPDSPLGKFMSHHKGNRKLEIANKTTKNPHTLPMRNGAVATEQMQIKTKNCLPNEQICANIKENLTLIKNWVSYVRPHDEPIVIASAGEGLSYHDIKPWYDKGVKIVCVKHAIERLLSWGITPWACVLLDPRPHVEQFVKRPNKDVIYFVASVVDPSVVKTLLENDCKVVGYHAFVGAGESALLSNGDFLVCGGSATATRSIGLLNECLGFKEFHCYGYDLCHYERPDPSVKDVDGQPKYIEITLGAKTWGNKDAKRTFWTEGQFLAQANELRDLYKMKNSFKINLYGQGMAAWQQMHFEQHAKWMEQHNQKLEQKRAHSPFLSDWEHGIKS